MKKNTQHNPTMMIKSSFSNKIHKLLNPCPFKRGTREFWDCMSERRKNPLTEKQKAELFDEVMKIYNESSNELRNYFYERSWKKHIHKERIKRGVLPKKKMTKDEYEKKVQN